MDDTGVKRWPVATPAAPSPPLTDAQRLPKPAVLEQPVPRVHRLESGAAPDNDGQAHSDDVCAVMNEMILEFEGLEAGPAQDDWGGWWDGEMGVGKKWFSSFRGSRQAPHKTTGGMVGWRDGGRVVFAVVEVGTRGVPINAHVLAMLKGRWRMIHSIPRVAEVASACFRSTATVPVGCGSAQSGTSK